MTKQAIEKGNKCKTEIGTKFRELNCYIAFLESDFCTGILSDRSKVRHINNNRFTGPSTCRRFQSIRILGLRSAEIIGWSEQFDL